MQVSAPAKVILFGEHAVVYGKPAIAVPVSSLRVTASIEERSSGGLEVFAPDLKQRFYFPRQDNNAEENAIEVAVRLTLERLQAKLPQAVIRLDSSIPIASGLGSGAAISTALVRALGSAAGRVLDPQTTNEIVYEVEKMHHGTPSGIDNTVIVYEQAVFFVRSQPIEPIKIGLPFSVLIADTGQGALTKVAVGDVRRLYEAEPERIQPVLERIGALVLEARKMIERGAIHALGQLMNENHLLLQQLTVSSPELDRLVKAALDGGAAGAKLSGGGRGGNMIALVTPDSAAQVRASLLKAGAVRVFETQVK